MAGCQLSAREERVEAVTFGNATGRRGDIQVGDK